jgi:hypothetical protein
LICESGAGLVHPEFRSGSLFNRMVEHGVEVGAPRHGIQAVFCEPVCNHVFSQKLCNTQGYLTCAMELSLMPSAAYVKEKSAKGRVSTTLVFKVLQPLAHQVYLPGDYAENLRELYEGLVDERELTASQPGQPSEDGTRLNGNYFEFARVARLALWRAGSDFPAVLDRELSSLHDKGVEVVQMWINLTNPHTDFIIKELRDRGYFLGGLLPRWFDVDGMLMQWLAAPPDWENMNLLFPRDMRVRDMVRADWKRSS